MAHSDDHRGQLFVPALLVLIGWGALAFGAAYPWGYVPLLVGCAQLGVYGLVGYPGIRGVPVALAVSLCAIAVAISLQLVPLSPAALAWVSPARETLVVDNRPAAAALRVGTDASVPGGDQPSFALPLSISPQRTAVGLALFLPLALFFLGSVRVFGIAGVGPVARGLSVIGTLVALVVVVHVGSGTDKVYGFWEARFSRSPFAPFVNRNHLAGWMAMTLPLTIGYFNAVVARATRGATLGWRKRILWLSTREANELVLVALAGAAMALSLVLSASKGGIACLAFALIVFGWMTLRRHSTASRRLLAVGLLVFVAMVVLGRADIARVQQRFVNASWETASGRLGIWRDTVQLVQDFPFTGTGLNTYQDAILDYQTFDLTGSWHQAHNDYLQLAAEGGLLLGLPILVAIVLFVREVRRRFREDADNAQTRWLRAGAVTGLVAIAMQELVEFSLQMPANAGLFAVLAAIAIHQPPRHHRHAARRDTTHSSPRIEAAPPTD